MSLNMKSITQALAKTAAVIEKTVQTTVQEVTGPRPLQDYELQDQIGSAGPGLAWKLFAAKPARGAMPSQQYTKVCVWVLDKRVLAEVRMRSGLSKAAEDAFFDIIRADASRLVRLRHPGVVHVVHALDESKNAMAMVTEPLFASVANVLGDITNIDKLPKELKGIEMGILEVKHGLLQIAESLDFVHNNANLVHRAISPENILITSNGAWKIGGFGFAVPADQNRGNLTLNPFHYSEYDVEDSLLPLQPSLNYIAPELVRSKEPSFGFCSDIFSLGCLAYHLISRKPLFDCHNNIKMYMNTLSYLSTASFSAVPRELVPELQGMLSTSEGTRPIALDFTASPFFRNDTRLRALRFLDHMLERDNMQKSEFLKALSDMWKDFDSRILRYKVLPPLCAELRNVVMQPMILPMVLTIAESQDRNEFELSTLPALLPVFTNASGETLLLLMRHADLIISKSAREHLVSHVLPMLVRAYDGNDTLLQEEVLKRSVSLAKQIDAEMVKKEILPRVHGLALRTTAAAVRVNALVCLSDLISVLDKNATLEILQTVHRCTAVDHSAPTLMCTLSVAHSVFKRYGLEFTLEHVLPLLMPLLSAQQLNAQQFSKYMSFVKDILRRVEEERGIMAPVSENPKAYPASVFGVGKKQQEGLRTTTSWDENWGPIGQSAQDALPTCPPVDVEWPLPASTDAASQVRQTSKQLPDASAASARSTFDDIDPFADWPPHSSGFSRNGMASQSGSNTGSTNRAITSNRKNSMNDVRQRQVGVNVNGQDKSQNSIGGLKQVQGSNDKKLTDVELLFASHKKQQAPRLAPPPSATIMSSGKGQGTVAATPTLLPRRHKKSSEQQPPLLDLL